MRRRFSSESALKRRVMPLRSVSAAVAMFITYINQR
jgi:hypothetical protein